jgi:hypothetical protein
LKPIDQLGVQLYPGSLANGYAADFHRGPHRHRNPASELTPRRTAGITRCIPAHIHQIWSRRRRTGCLPGLRPDLLCEDRCFAGCFDHGTSDDGGREEFDESAEDPRFNSASSSACSVTTRSSSSTRAVNCPPACCSCS